MLIGFFRVEAGPSSAPPDYDRETLFLGMDSIATSYIEGAQSFGPFEPDPPSFSPLITIRRPERPSADSPLLPPLVTSFSWSTVGQSRETDDEGMQLSISSAYEEMREEEDEEEAERDE